MTRRLEDATASDRRSRTGYIERSEDVLGYEPNPLDPRLEDDTSDVCKVATSSRFLFSGGSPRPRVPLRSAPPVIEMASSRRFHRPHLEYSFIVQRVGLLLAVRRIGLRCQRNCPFPKKHFYLL